MGIYTKVATDGGKWVEIGTDGSVGADLVGGVAGWAAIESVSGAASLDDLKAAGIAPESAIADNECPGTYNITADGVVWRVAVFTGDGSISTSDGLVDALLVSGGGGSASYIWGNGGNVRHSIVKLTNPSHAVTVGVASTMTGENEFGTPSSIGTIVSGLTGSSYSVGVHPSAGMGSGGTIANPQAGYVCGITGTDVEYGIAAQSTPRENKGDGGSGINGGSVRSSDGIVVVRAPKDAANNPKPDVSMPWGDFTTNGDENASGEWGPDGEGRTWKWAEWNVANDYSVNLTGGLYWVLTTSAGSNGPSSEMGQPGTVVEGYWEFSPGDTPITVGEAFPKGPNAGQGGGGGPSSIGDYGNQGWTSWGDPNIGRGSTPGYGGTLAERYLGYSSTITGVPQGYAPSSLSTSPLNDRPGRSGYDGSTLATDGCVIIATVTNDPSEWNPPGALPGIGGWATITAVSGDYTPHRYNDGPNGVGGTDWVAYEWTDDGTVRTTDGLIDVLLVGGGGWGRHNTPTGGEGGGNGATLVYGIFNSDYFGSSPHAITIGAAGTSSGWGGKDSTFGSVRSIGGTSTNYSGEGGDGAGGLHSGSTGGAGLIYAISGAELEYAAGGNAGSPQKNPITYGSGAGNGVSPGSGVVIIRVPAANAQGVSETRHGWLNFATVENGVVTSVNKTPDNITYTTAVNEIPCGPEVAEGWNYDGSEFVAPEPDYSEQIKELEEQLKNLRGDL